MPVLKTAGQDLSRSSLSIQKLPFETNETMSLIMPLLQGSIFYKKFSSSQSLKQRSFDPLDAELFPPESCGYGIRFIQLDKSLKYLNIRQNLKNTIEFQIPVGDIFKPILPQTTLEIIKISKKAKKEGVRQTVSGFDKKNSSVSLMVKTGMLNKNSALYKQKCMDCSYLPFSIALHRMNTSRQSVNVTESTSSSMNHSRSSVGFEKSGRIELIATSYEVLKQWTVGINTLL